MGCANTEYLESLAMKALGATETHQNQWDNWENMLYQQQKQVL
jgi:hypothetical protein